MTERLSLPEYRTACKRPSKYKNVAVCVDGYRFDSKLEAKRYGELKQLRAAGEVLWFICQPPFRLPGRITYRADFLVVWKDFRFPQVEDCKGVMTQVSQNKIKQVEEIYGIKVELIRA